MPSSGRGVIWHRIASAALLHGDALRAGLTTSALLERTAAPEFNAPLEYKEGVKSALKLMRSPELSYVAPSQRGQRGLMLGPGLGMVIGASVGTRSCRAVLVHPHGWIAEDGDGVPCCEIEPGLDGQLDLPPGELLERLARPIRRLVSRAAAEPSLSVHGKVPLLGIAVGWASALYHSKRPAGSALSHEAWDAASAGLNGLLARHLGLPEARSHAINDANAAAIWAAWRIASPTDRRTTALRAEVNLCLRLSGAIGAGAVIVPVPDAARRPAFLDSSLIEGKTGVAGDLAHLYLPRSVVQEIQSREPPLRGLEPIRGVACSCGRLECLESFAGGKAVLDRLHRSGVDVDRNQLDMADDELAGMLATTRHRLVDRSLRDAGRLLGLALAGPVLMLNPRSVTLTGFLAQEPVRRGIVEEQAFWSHPNDSAFDVLLPRDHGNVGDPASIVAHGAALAVLRAQLYRRFWPVDGDPGYGDIYAPRNNLLPVSNEDLA